MFHNLFSFVQSLEFPFSETPLSWNLRFNIMLPNMRAMDSWAAEVLGPEL